MTRKSRILHVAQTAEFKQPVMGQAVAWLSRRIGVYFIFMYYEILVLPVEHFIPILNGIIMDVEKFMCKNINDVFAPMIMISK